MIWFIFVSLIALFVFIILALESELFTGLLASFSVFLFGCLVAGAISCSVGYYLYPQFDPEPYSYELVSLKDNINTSGAFILGSGTINSSLYYYAYRLSQGGFEFTKIPATNTILYEKNVNTALYTKYDDRFKVELWGFRFPRDKKATLAVPEGTIMKNIYEIDLQ